MRCPECGKLVSPRFPVHDCKLPCGCSGSFECPEAVKRWAEVNRIYQTEGYTEKYKAAVAHYRAHKDAERRKVWQRGQ